MIFDKWSLLRILSPDPNAAGRLASRWAAAAEGEPALVSDIIRMGGVLAQGAREFEDGVEKPLPLDPYRMAEEKGRREFALELLALMSFSPHDLRQLMEQNSDFDDN